MITQMQLTWITSGLLLILTVLPCCRTLQVSIPQNLYRVSKGDDVTLTCSFSPARPVSDTFILRWEALPVNLEDRMDNVGTYFLNGQVDIAPTFEGRAFLEVNMDQKESTLRLTKVTMEDSRDFRCSVIIPNDDEGTTAAITTLLVLVPPSPPVCKIQGRTEYWQNINITCKSEEGSPQPVTEWKTFSVENVPRPFPPKTTEKGGVLSLFNISRETSGFFVCTSTNEIGSNTCNISVAVVPASMNIASTIGIVGGVVAGVVVVAIIICCCCRRRGKKQMDAEGSPETVYYDKDAPEAGEPYLDKKPTKELKQFNQNEAKTGPGSEDDRHSNSGKDRDNVQNSDTGSQHYQQDHYRGSRDHLDDRRDRYGSRDHLNDQRDRYGGSRDNLDDRRDRYGGSRDNLDDRRDRYGGSRDNLDDRRDRYGGSRDNLNDRRDRYGGSRDNLDDRRDRYGGSRDNLDDRRDRYGGSKDNLDDRRDRYGGSRDHLDDSDHYRSGRGDVDNSGGHYRN